MFVFQKDKSVFVERNRCLSIRWRFQVLLMFAKPAMEYNATLVKSQKWHVRKIPDPFLLDSKQKELTTYPQATPASNWNTRKVNSFTNLRPKAAHFLSISDSALLKQRQCVLVEEKEDVCSEIESNLPEDVALNVCVVTQAKRSVADELEDDELILFNESSRSAKDDNNRDDEEGSGEGEDGAGAITVSLALLAAAFFFVLIN